MALLKKSAPAEFRVPSLAEADETYSALGAKHAELAAKEGMLRAERQRLEHEIENDPKPALRAGVAALLGDAEDTRGPKMRRLAEVRREHADVDAAIAVVRDRLRHAKGPASTRVRAAIKAEYAKRVTAMCDALKALHSAREAYEELTDAMDAEDVEWSALGNFKPIFLGERRDGHAQRFLREAREAGYVN